MTEAEIYVAAYEVLLEAGEDEASDAMIENASDEALLLMLDVVVGG